MNTILKEVISRISNASTTPDGNGAVNELPNDHYYKRFRQHAGEVRKRNAERTSPALTMVMIIAAFITIAVYIGYPENKPASLELSNTTVSELARILMDEYDITLEVSQPQLNSYTLSGKFQDPDECIETLVRLNDLTIERISTRHLVIGER